MKIKCFFMIILAVVGSQTPALAKEVAKDKKITATVEKRGLSNTPLTNNEVLANFLINQVLKKKLLDKDNQYVYPKLKIILERLAGHKVESVSCEAVSNGGSLCVLSLIYQGDEDGNVYYELQLSVNRKGEVTSAQGRHLAPPSNGGVG